MPEIKSVIINGEVYRLILARWFRQLPHLHGYCACGCGDKTSIAKRTVRRQMFFAGEPIRFIHGHHARLKEYQANLQRPRGDCHPNWKNGRRVDRAGYVYIYQPNHPRRNHRNQVAEHILVCEKALGKYLPSKAEPHHIDGDAGNNKNNNLVICENHAYHMLLHQRARAYKNCGHAAWRKCTRLCNKYDDPKNLTIVNSCTAYHKYCNAVYHKNLRDQKKENNQGD